MKFSDMEFFVKEAWLGYLRSGIMSVVSIGTITISLIVFGIFLLLIFNVNNLMSGLSGKLEIVLYVNEISDSAREQLAGKVEKAAGVREVVYKPKKQSWEEFQERFQGQLSLNNLLDENPLPDSFIVKVKAIDRILPLSEQFAKYPEVNDVRYGGELAEKINRSVRFVKIFGGVLIFLLGLATLLIVINTIRLTVLARHEEIAIMKLVGATDGFIKWPFILEGLFIGITGGILATLFLMGGYYLLVGRLQETLPFLPFVYSKFKLAIIYSEVLAVGIILGLLGGYISVGKSLRNNV